MSIRRRQKPAGHTAQTGTLMPDVISGRDVAIQVFITASTTGYHVRTARRSVSPSCP
jgi:hypothetical protein